MMPHSSDAPSFRRLLSRAVLLPLLLLVMLAGLLFAQIRSLLDVTRWVDHTDQVISQAYSLQKLLLDRETGLRGYLLTGRPAFLAPYRQAAPQIESTLRALDPLVSDNPAQVRRLSELREQYLHWSRFAEAALAVHDRGGDYLALVRARGGKDEMDAMRHALTAVLEAEEGLRVARSRVAQQAAQNVLVIGPLVTVLFGGVLAFFARRQLIALSGSYRQALESAHARAGALQESEERFRLLVEGVRDYATLMLDPAGRVVTWNAGAERLKGYRAGEILGQHFSRFYLPEDVERGRPERELAMAAAEGQAKDEGWRVRKDGSRFWAEVLVTALRDETGQLRGFIKVTHDITERKQREDEIRQLNESLERRVAERTAQLEWRNRELEDFAYVASHDLQEPLRKIQAFGDRLTAKCGAALTEDGRLYVERIQDAARRMQTLVNDLLAFSRVTTKAQPFVPVDLGVVTREVLGDLETRLEQTGGHVEVGTLPTIDADPTQMRQLLQNLIGNALKFHRENEPPSVKLFASLQNGAHPSGRGSQPSAETCQLLVEDNGIGFEEQYLDRIFTPFQRLHGRGEYEGTGIGLAICRKIAERHGGGITARSAPGQGATFVVTLPVRHAEEENGT